MSSEKVTQLPNSITSNRDREVKQYEFLDDFQGLDPESIFEGFSPNSPYNTEYSIEYKRRGDSVSHTTKDEFITFKEQTASTLEHQKELDTLRYEALSEKLSTSVENSLEKSTTLINNSIEKLQTSQSNYLENLQLKNDIVLKDFKEEMRKERKSNRNTYIGWMIGGMTVIVSIVVAIFQIFF